MRQRLGWAVRDARCAEFEASLTDAEVAQLSRLPRGLRAKLYDRMGLPPPEGDRRGRHWAELRGARRYELRDVDGSLMTPGRLCTVEEAAARLGVTVAYLADQLERRRGTRREVDVEGQTVAERDPAEVRPPGRPRVRRAGRAR